MSEPQPEEEPKIIVDDDWKEQVEKEKEALRMAEQKAKESPAETAEPAEPANAEQQAVPPASLMTLISMLFTQAMAMLGQIPDPTTGKASVDKPIAKHYIDTLEMLEQKTKGNVDDEEAKMFAEALHALRITYVSAQGEP